MTQSTSSGARTLAGFTGTIVLVGAGRMGGAMLEGWLALGLDPKSVAAIEPQPARELSALAGRGLRLNPPAHTVGEATAIVIAVKPQVAPEIVPTLAPYLGAATVVLSIMAGRTLGFLEQALSQRVALVRAMPNTPAAIGRYIVDRHHGEVAMASAGTGQGTVCTVWLPLLDATAWAVSPPVRMASSSLQGLRLLVVDDEPDSGQLLHSILSQYGASVTTTDNARSALQQTVHSDFDVIVTDVGLPDFDGVELVRQLRALGKMMPAVAVTAFATDVDRHRLLTTGFDGHVSKPVDTERLIRVVAGAAGRQTTAS